MSCDCDDETAKIADDVAAWFDDPDFAGIVFQHYHVVGDEQIENGNPYYVPRSHGREQITAICNRGGDPFSFRVRPVFFR